MYNKKIKICLIIINKILLLNNTYHITFGFMF